MEILSPVSDPQDIASFLSTQVIVSHGADTAFARPDVPRPVIWVGSVDPANKISGDVVINTSGGSGGFTHDTWTPTVTASTGTLTSATGTGRYSVLGDHVYFDIRVTITTNGTGSGEIRATLPFNVKTGHNYVGVGREIQATGIIVQAFMAGGSSFVSLHDYSNGYIGADNRTFVASGFYRRA